MDNNDILIRVRYALDIRDVDMVEIFKLGGIEINREDIKKMLVKPKRDYEYEGLENKGESIRCSNIQLDSFLNGFIIFKRGKQEPKPGQKEKAKQTVKTGSLNNVMLKKIKIALSLTSEDMLHIFNKAGINVTKGELGSLLRKEGDRRYTECGDKYARNFLKGLTQKYRG